MLRKSPGVNSGVAGILSIALDFLVGNLFNSVPDCDHNGVLHRAAVGYHHDFRDQIILIQMRYPPPW